MRLLLSAIAASVVTMLAAGPAAATVGSCPAPVFLHLNTPGKALTEAAPGPGTAAFVELPALRRSGGNPYVLFGEWDGSFESDADCTDVYDLQLWLGLKNSDDQGTNFDLKVEVFVNGNPVSTTTEFLCIKGVTRNPTSSVQVSAADFASFSQNGSVDIALKVSARIASASCGGHASATGLRLYYGSEARDSHFAIGEIVTESTSCDATGCSLGPVDSADGSTTVNVDVPGGGQAGTLTIVLSTPPENDGCFGNQESPPPPIGSEVTVVPPGGYTPGNPITVDITYNSEVTVTAVCKSNNGNLPFRALPSCTFVDENPTPTNVPCWESLASNEVIVYMTSTDPAFVSH